MKLIFSFIWKYKLHILAALGAILTFGYIHGLLAGKQKAEGALHIKLKEVTTLKTNNGQLVQQIDVIKKATSEQLKAATDSIFKLNKKDTKKEKEISRLSVIAQQVSLHGTITAEYEHPADSNIEDISCDSLLQLFQFAIFTPEPFSYKSDSINIGGIVLHTGVAINKIEIPDTLYERDLVLKTGFLNLGRKHSSQLYHTNSMFSNNGAAVYTVDKTAPWLLRVGKPVLTAVLGFGAGYLMFHK